MLKALIILFTASASIILILIYLYRQKTRELHDVRRLYTNLMGATGFESIIKILIDEINDRGIKLLGFYRKNRITNTLETSDGHKVPLLEQSSIAKAFYTLSPCKLSKHHDVDRQLIEKLGPDTIFIPIHMEKEANCWEVNDCGGSKKVTCGAYHNNNCLCWIKSGKVHKGKTLKTHSEKLTKCLSCKCFLPIGVFAVQGKRIGKVHSFINNHFQGALKNSVLYEREVYKATKDELTGIDNRRSLGEQMQMEFHRAERYNQPLSVCMFDIDHFKKFNDNFGHDIGDFVLRELAQYVLSLVRDVDFFARWGGEEFYILFTHTPKDTAVKVADRIREKVEDYMAGKLLKRIGEDELSKKGTKTVTISMGISEFPDDMTDEERERTKNAKSVIPDLFMKKADIALYQSKENGRNCVTAYCSDFPEVPKKKVKDTENKKAVVME